MTPHELSQALLDTVTDPKDEDTVAKVVGAVKTLAETEKLRLEGEKFRLEAANTARLARSDNRRFVLTVLAPSLSALAVILALAVQFHQVAKNATLQRETNDATNLREALKLVTSQNPGDARAGSLFLASLLRSPTYGQTARAVILTVLAIRPDENSFNSLLRALMTTTTWNDLNDIVGLERGISYGRWRALHPKPGVATELPSGEASTDELLEAELGSMQDAISRFLLEHQRPPGYALDLSGVDLFSHTLPNVNLSGANLDNASFVQASLKAANLDRAEVTNADLTDAVLDEVTHFENSHWNGTAWWRAKAMSHELLGYLKTEYPFSGAVKYRPSVTRRETKDPSTEYRENVSKLEVSRPYPTTTPGT